MKRDRLISKAAIITSSAMAAVSATGEVLRPLQGMHFILIGKLSRSKADVEKILSDLGGEIASKPSRRTAAVISTKGSGIFLFFAFIMQNYFLKV